MTKRLLIVLMHLLFVFEAHCKIVKTDSISDIELNKQVELKEVLVTSTGVSAIKRSSYNAVTIDTKDVLNTTKTISDALSKSPGMKIRENGGLGSDMQVMMDGFSGKHVKVFIDGVPQSSSSSFGISSIPVGFAEKIEVYKGVVPVGFATDAIGGVINVVTKQSRKKWWLDASYSFGSFNTHKTNISFGQNFSNGIFYDVRLLQNYSDNNYSVKTFVEDFSTGAIDKQKTINAKRFNDTFHNEAAIANIGIRGKSWADRLIVGLRYSRMHKDIQTGVRQDVVYGAKYRYGNSLVPTLKYSKRNAFVEGLNINLSAEYDRSANTNVDTSAVKYNWLRDTKLLNSPGEQAYQNLRNNSKRWNVTGKVDYRLNDANVFTLSHLFSSYSSRNTSLLNDVPEIDEYGKKSVKNITGFSYRFLPNRKFDANIFAKLYVLNVNGPVLVDVSKLDYTMAERNRSAIGYGAAASYGVVRGLLLKLSYEKAYRLPTIEEMFGDDDLEKGDADIKPENSHNLNLALNYGVNFGVHSLFAEVGAVYRRTADYIQRNIVNISGGKSTATYINYGQVLSKGGNASLRYNYKRFINAGVNFTYMDIRDNMKTLMGSSASNSNYKERMPNVPYAFGDADISFSFPNIGLKQTMLTVTYDNQYLHSFSYYGERIGSNADDYLVPTQFSHNVAVTYSLCNGKYNLSAEVKNISDELLYDNFHLQKAGRSFNVKVRVNLGK